MSLAQTIRSVIGVGLLLILPFLMAAQGEAQEKTSARGELVAGFPSIPTYPGAVVKQSDKIVEQNKTGFEAILISDDSVFNVYSWYLKALTEDGWKITFASDNSSTAQEQGLRAVRAGLRLYLNFDCENGRTEIDVEIPLQAGIGR